jgi:hypothetical protein
MLKLAPIPMASLAALLGWGTITQAWASDRHATLADVTPQTVMENICDSDVVPNQAVRLNLAESDNRGGPELTRSNVT